MGTLKPSSPGFSGSKSYNAVQHGVLVIGVRAGDFIGDGNGDAVTVIIRFKMVVNSCMLLYYCIKP